MLRMPAADKPSRPVYLSLPWVLIGALSLPMFTGCSEHHPSPAPGETIPDVTVIRAETKTVPIKGTWVATLDGAVNAQIQPQVSGYLISQNYREGSEVSIGQVLYQIDPKPFAAVLEQAEGALDQAKAQLDLAEINVNRDTPLVEARAISKSQLDT